MTQTKTKTNLTYLNKAWMAGLEIPGVHSGVQCPVGVVTHWL